MHFNNLSLSFSSVTSLSRFSYSQKFRPNKPSLKLVAACSFPHSLPLFRSDTQLHFHVIDMLGKARKVSGRGEAMTANYAFGPSDDDVIIKHRLLTRTTTTRGDPPLKKLQKKFTSFVSEVHKDEDNFNDCEKLARAFRQELTTFEIPLLKSKAIVDANVREKENFNELKDEMNRQILQAQADIEDLKKQLEESKVERRHKEECEAIRKLIALQPPRLETQKDILELEKELAALDTENITSSRSELRKKQFALLLHVVDELQNTIEEEQKSLVEEMRMASEELKNGMEETNGGRKLWQLISNPVFLL